jgi:antirestriction protein
MEKRRLRFHLWVAVAVLCFSLLAIAGTKETDNKSVEGSQKMRARLEQLFIWRVSDRLHLTSEEEAKFTAEYKRLSDERTQASAKMEDILAKLGDEKVKKTKVKLLSDYEEVFKKYTDIQQEEMTAMKKLFDTDRLADYVLLKRDMRHRFRDVLAKNGEDANSGKSSAKEKEAPVAPETK